MKKIILPSFFLAVWLIVLSVDIPVGNNFVPAPGRFLDPFEGIWKSVRADLSSKTIKGHATGAIRILLDERDVPHIYAHNLEDALYAQGYLHAANRLFSMELSTRAAAGRLSELVGSRALAHDHQQREAGFEWSAIQKAKYWETDPRNKSLLDAYTRGINDYIASLDYKDWPVEYKILSHKPATWTTTHTALMATNMAIILSMSESDLINTTARSKLTKEEFDYLYPAHNPLESPVIPDDKKWEFKPVIISTDTFLDLPDMEGKSEDDKEKDLNGSNNWALAPRKTANGFALLANDPHLNLTLPNIWYELEIHTPEMSVHGASIPGLPFVVIGFNEFIAWGTTNSGQDVLDWYRITWKDSSRQEYLLDGKYEKAQLREERIKVRGIGEIVDTVRYTYWGPVISRGEHTDMAMRWIGHVRSAINDVAYLEKINQARNVSDYREAIRAFQYPAQNKVFASVEGDIAISVAGTMPLRPPGDQGFILDGDTRKNDWQGFIPFEHAPFVINPAKGFVSSANQAPVGRSYPYPVAGSRIFEDYRGRVLNSILDTMANATVDDMKQLQQNNFNLHAAELLPLLLNEVEKDSCFASDKNKYLHTLRSWQFEQHRDSVAPVLFELWHSAFEAMMFDELDSLGVMYPEDWRIIELVRDHDQHTYFDLISTPQVETLRDIACASYSEMVKTYESLDSNLVNNWGSYKQTEIPHLARLKPFGVSQLHTSGAKHIVNAMGKSHGPSWRMIVEMSKPPKAFVNYPGGQSGNPSSPHYTDMLDRYFEGHYYEVRLHPDPDDWTPARKILIQPL